MGGVIFISYRRDDSEGEAGRLYDDLSRIFGAEDVFMDVSDIHPGKDFRQAIDENVAKCSVLLAMIGPDWTTIQDGSGTRRLDQPNDFVRLEIASALARGVDVIPVLVHGARMPAAADLPDNLQSLAFRNCVELTHARWNSDVEVLSRSLRQYVDKAQELPTRSIRMAITGENPVIKASDSQPDVVPTPPRPAMKTVRRAGALVAICAVAIAAVGTYVYMHHQFKPHDKMTAESPETSSGPSAVSAPSAKPAVVPATVAPAHRSSHPPTDTLAGTWINALAEGGKPMRLEIAALGDSVTVHLWTRCHDAACDLGTKTIPLSDSLTIEWNGQFSKADKKKIKDRSVTMHIQRAGAGLHMVYSVDEGGSEEFDFVRSE